MTRAASARGLGRMVNFATYAAAVLYNGLGRYDAAREAARAAFEHRDHVGVRAVRRRRARRGGVADRRHGAARGRARLDVGAHAGDPHRLGAGDRGAGARASERRATPTREYRESIERLQPHAPARGARARRICSTASGCAARAAGSTRASSCASRTRRCSARWARTAFAERARHELLATGETVRKRTDDTRDELTPQEEHIARLALDGRTNPEIGAELFLSPRTVEWHLKKVFTKLGISSRKGLRDALPARHDAVVAA